MIHRKLWFLLLSTMLLAALFRSLGLDWQSLWYDEGTSLDLAISPPDQAFLAHFLDFLRTHPASERFQPLYFVILHGWTSVFGTSDIALRALSVIFATLYVLVMTLLTKRALGMRAMLWVALFSATSAYAIYYGQEVRPYALAMMLSSIVLLALYRVLIGPKPATTFCVGFAILCLLLLATNVFAAVFLAALALSHLALRRGFPAWLKLWLPSGLLCCVALVLWLKCLGSGAEAAVPVARNIIENLVFVPYGLLVGQTYGPPLQALRGNAGFSSLVAYIPHVVLLFVIMAAWLFTFFQAHPWRLREIEARDQRHANTHAFTRLILMATALGYLGGAFGGVVIGLNWLPRHAFYLHPLLTLMLALPLASITTSSSKRRFAMMTAYSIVALNLFSTAKYFCDPLHARDDYRGAAEVLMQPENRTATALLLWGNPTLLDHYGANAVMDGRDILGDDIGMQISQRSNNATQVIAVINREFYWNKGLQLDERLAPQYTFERAIQLSNMGLYVMRRKADAPDR
ncbi:MAG: hypothetical protein ACI9OU_000050 [Candidatus Promineifilaceae bacterium]|jgi:hypothetical protein